MVAKRNSKKVVADVVVNNESEVVKMENVKADVVENVVADVVEVDENVQALADLADAEKIDAETLQHAPENDENDDGAPVDADENGDGEKKQRKPRAKMDVTPFDVDALTNKYAGGVRGYILQALQADNVENAETLADAFSKGVVYGVLTDVIIALEKKFQAYANTSYKNSNNWLVFENTGKIVTKKYTDITNSVKAFYACTNEKVCALRENTTSCVGNAKYTVDNFIEEYFINDVFNINVQIQELKQNNIDVVYVPKSAHFASVVLDKLTDNGYELDGKLTIPERSFTGVNGVFPAVCVWRLVRENN